MPLFKTNQDIFKTYLEESYDSNMYDKPWVDLPPNPLWDYSRELQIEDVDIWEVITEIGGGTGVYASWMPYAEFYMIRNKHVVETFYGKFIQPQVRKRLDELNIPYPKHLPEPNYELLSKL
jgi:hypothetical protein